MNNLSFILFPVIGLFLLPDQKPFYPNSSSSFVEAFQNISPKPLTIELINEIEWDATGGHLQGIQLYEEKGKHFAYISGSSASNSYLVKTRIDQPAQVIEIYGLLAEPYRHAGGFQIYDRFLAVGVEDNYARTSSKILIYDISTSNASNWDSPFYTIDREGPFEQQTAGAVGITKFRNRIWVAVANWNSRNIDFYTSDLKKFYDGQGIFQKVASIEASRLDKSGWSDSDWWSYQNINLAVDEQEQLYMAAFTRDEQDFNRADLFLLQFNTPPNQDFPVFNTEEKGFHTVNIDLQKISSKTFDCMDKTDFRAGSGLHLMRDGKWAIVSCPNGLEKTTTIHLFSEKKQ